MGCGKRGFYEVKHEWEGRKKEEETEAKRVNGTNLEGLS
jgi:hypothetical protein